MGFINDLGGMLQSKNTKGFTKRSIKVYELKSRMSMFFEKIVDLMTFRV